MTRILIEAGIFVLGLTIGGWATGTFVSGSMNIKTLECILSTSVKAMVAGQLRAGLSHIIHESTDRQ